jgi:CxxC-x17-CxxC domain-containing protein
VSFEDKTLVCRDCGEAFTFTAGEQEFYAQKGFTNEPMRCRNCRRARKEQRNGGSTGERSYGGGGYRSEGNSRGGADFGMGGGYSQGNDYGNSYSQGNDYGNSYPQRGNDYGSAGRGSDYGASGGYGSEGYVRRERVQHETVCAQCGRPTTVPFVPSGGRPVYCQECFAQRRGPSAGRGPSRGGGYNRF